MIVSGVTGSRSRVGSGPELMALSALMSLALAACADNDDDA